MAALQQHSSENESDPGSDKHMEGTEEDAVQALARSLEGIQDLHVRRKA